ncbi:MAG TPA: creatininase family protein [Acidobacteriota bacterium]|nr:creatininase family protein [Acidobacteriota bacterium]
MTNYWGDKSWTDLKQNPPDIVLLPIGSVEAHGPHLPLSTDSIISDEMARRAADALAQHSIYAVILPPLHYVVTDFSKDFPGTISIRKEAFQSLLENIADSLRAQGIRHLCIVNSHLEPDHIAAVHEFCEKYKGLKVLFPDKTRKPWASLLTSEFRQGACHAGSYETSLILASDRKDLVKDSRKELPQNDINLAKAMKQGVKSFRDAGAPQAYFGDPASATQREGEQTYAILTQMIVETVLGSLRPQ